MAEGELITPTTYAVTNNTNGHCVEFGSLKIQWGTAGLTAGQNTTINLPKAFSNTSYVVNFIYDAENPDLNGVGAYGITHKTTNSFNAKSNGGQYGWIAIGY